MKRPQGQQGQRTNGKAPFNGRPRFNSDKVHFNQDREAAGNRMHGKRPPLKKAYNAGYNSQAGSNGGHHGPKHQGGSLEELLMGNYKGKHFDPTKSRKYTALAAYFREADRALQVLSRVPQEATEHQATPYCLFRISRDFPRSTTTSTSHSPLKGVARSSMTWTPYSIPMKATTLKWKK
jgi:hypothetical protein